MRSIIPRPISDGVFCTVNRIARFGNVFMDRICVAGGKARTAFMPLTVPVSGMEVSGLVKAV